MAQDRIFKSILEMKNGAFMEVTDDDSRQNIAVGFETKTTLAPVNPQVTMLYDSGENVVEMTPQVPGQVDLNGVVSEGPRRNYGTG